MGATMFQVSIHGESAEHAYQKAIDEATYENGNDTYNGTISTTLGFSDVTKTFKASGKSLGNFIQEQYKNLGKRDCLCVCMKEPKESKNKIKTQVKHNIEKGTKKWLLKYIVTDDWTSKVIGSFNSKGDAVKAARKYTEKTKITTLIEMQKVLESGSPKVAEVTYKLSKSEREGKWVFFGWGAD
jgi:Ni,Fe-hydrogenase III component G